MSLIGDIAAPYALIMRPFRAIGTIIPDVVVEELHRDEMVITDHPVEIGAAISDHAFMLPAQIEMRCGFSNSTAQTEGYVQAIYRALLNLQSSREPFTVSTGKRNYKNMLIRGLAVINDTTSEHALMVIASLREVIIVNTQGANAPSSAQAQPQQTAPVQNMGTQSAIPYSGTLPFFAQGSTPTASLGIPSSATLPFFASGST